VVVLLLALAVLSLLSGCGEPGGQSAPDEAGAPPAAGSAGSTGATGATDASGSDDDETTPSATPSAKATAATPKAPDGVVTKIVFVNVGQGDAILIKSGKADVLVDGGPEGSEAAVSAAMRKVGMDEIDVVVATHMHADHVYATDDLIDRYRPGKLVLAGSCLPILKQASQHVGAKLEQARRGETFRWGAVKAKVLSPAKVSGEANEDSVVLLLEVAGRRLLLTGDLTGPNEAAVGSICARGPPLFLLKVSHHGSRYSTGSGFLSDTDPKFAIISVGPNSYGHPTPDTVKRLRSSGARVFTTQKNGTIVLTIKPSGAVSWKFGKTSKPVTSVASAASTSTSSTSTSTTSTSSASSTTSSSSSSATIVYITKTGECYHTGTCRYLSQSKIKITLKDAKARGYRACSVCRPPQ
jgi:competence protein ComEC